MERNAEPTLYFYQGDKFHMNLRGPEGRTVFLAKGQPLAERLCGDIQDITQLLATDIKGSVLKVQADRDVHSLLYATYGFTIVKSRVWSLLKFNAEHQDSLTGHYSLGAGYRQYNPILMRFNCPDSWSPFGDGGMNAYAYTLGDPINHTDPTGHMPFKGAAGKSFKVKHHNKNNSNSAAVLLKKGNVDAKGYRGKKSGATDFFGLEASPTERVYWRYSKAGAKFSSKGLNSAEQKVFDDFQNAIHGKGEHPKTAAKLAGDTAYKEFDKTNNIFQIRLSEGKRVLFVVNNRRVEIREVGGHS